MSYDIIIVGSGPAGITAAYQLNELDYDVLLLDKNTFPRPKLCAGLLTKKTRALINEVFGVNTAQLRKDKVIDYSSDFYQIYFKDRLVYESEMEAPFYYVDRNDYDNYLFNLVKEKGVEVRENIEVVNINFRENTIFTADGEEIKGSYIIGADGANSIIRKKFFENKKGYKYRNFKKEMAISLEAIVPRSEVKINVDFPILYYGFLRWGYGWIFPRRDSLVIGIAGLREENKGKNFHQLFKDYLSLIGIKNKNIDYQGWQLPYGNFIEGPVYNNTLLVGDAAGLVEPLTGEGIFYAHKSALLAAEAIDNAEKNRGNLETNYNNLLESELLARLDKFKKLSKFFYSQPTFMQKALLSISTKLAGGYLTELIQEEKL